jgi:hypothetical protein
MVAGGDDDTVGGDYSFAAGRAVRVDTLATHTFAFGRVFTTSTPHAAVFYSNSATFRMGIGVRNPTHALEMASGAHCTFAGNWINASSREHKRNIASLTSSQAIQTVTALDPVTYEHELEADETYVGFIAEDVPDLVATKDRKGLSPMDIVAVLTKVVQHQQEQIERLNREMESLRDDALRRR